ncbi:efflux transporter, outer membrane factor (OMF) lipoprotein, NodT family [Thiohalospira halophila DSM 15071]|uniref:Efflux transporter, outer membrane factor (OMF) lipoprotein, NodT family n=1 Tax=Thiohalospira halophila DSM 15071 TaxID=1123397 RepID=A0A1I1RU44_9GAMM|nr:efflux transporter outer membrane subunit [Thiohalospira halophila]SFD37894.1 efflux transporter, outer membrane factor (OMF) lipoprotein, NodT family [Thiohalospira halophila DSM 15071]
MNAPPQRPNRLLPGLASLLALLVGGCAVTPPERADHTPELPDSFSEAGVAEAPQRWWRSLEDPALDALVERALDSNLSLEATRARLERARAVARREGAPLIPSVEANAGIQEQGRGTDLDQARGSGATETVSAGLSASYEVDLWGRVRAGQAAATASIGAARADLQAAAVSLSGNVATTWYRRVEAQRRLDLLRRQVATAEDLLALTETRYRRGQVAIADVHRQRRSLEALRGQVSTARASLATLDHELAVLLGEPAIRLEPPEGDGLPNLGPLPETGLPTELVRRRPDLRRAFHDLVAADASVAAAVARRFPRLNLSASLTGEAPSASAMVATWLINLGAQLTLPLIDGGERRADVDRARAEAEAAALDYGQAVLEAVAEVEDALAREAREAERVDHLTAELDAARALLENTQRRYRFGEADHLAVLDAQDGVHAAERSLLEARRQRLEYRIQLLRALAGGWEMDEQEEAA